RMSDRQIRRRADDLGIAADLREVVGRGDYDCAILALGASGYPSSARIGELVEAFAPETRFVVCDGDQLAESGEGVVTLRIDASDDRPAPAVRGRAVRRFLEWIAGIAR
ncbi:MAG: hypothetical protein ABEL76_00310, partial [Bradymonadaceae bacterium]